MGIGRREEWKLCGFKEELPASRESRGSDSVPEDVAVQTGAQTVIDKRSTGWNLDQNCSAAHTSCQLNLKHHLRIGYYRTHSLIHPLCVAMLNKYSFCAFHYFCLNWFRGYEGCVCEGCRAQLWPEILQWQTAQLEVALSTPRLDDCLGRKSDASIAKGTDARRAALSSQGTSSWPPDKLNGNDLVEDKREEDWGPFKGSVGSVVSMRVSSTTSRRSVPINLDTNMSNLLKHLFQLLENFINEYYI